MALATMTLAKDGTTKQNLNGMFYTRGDPGLINASVKNQTFIELKKRLLNTSLNGNQNEIT